MEAHRAFLCRLIALRAEEHLDGDYHQVLLACSLVCREFRAIALSYVFCFKRVNLTDRRRVRDLWYLTRPLTLPATPPGKKPLPNPLQFIRELSISALEDAEDEGYASEGPVWISDEELLAPLIRDIISQKAAAGDRLTGFTLHTTRPLEWALCSNDLRYLLSDVILSYPLCEVMLGGISGLPPHVLLKAMMHADTLLIEDVAIQKGATSTSLAASRTAAADLPEMGRGLLSRIAVPLKELNIVTSPGVVPVLTEWMSSSRGLSFENVKRLALTEIRLGELPWAMRMIQRMAASRCILDSLELSLAPIPARNLSLMEGLDSWSFPSELFSNLQSLDITLPTLFADEECTLTSFEVLRLLFAGMAEENWGGPKIPVLNELCVRIHEGEEEDIGSVRALVVNGAKPWTAVAASLGRFAPHLQAVDIRISCESERRCAYRDQAVERQLRKCFSCLSPSVDFVFVLRCASS